VQVDLEDDRFDITYDPARVDVDRLLGVIRRLEYEPRVVERAHGSGPAVPTRVDVADLPPVLASLFAEARTSGKPVLIAFSGPG
jgi:hypothetical protein